MTFGIDLSKNALPLPAWPRSLVLSKIEFCFNDRTSGLELHHTRGGVTARGSGTPLFRMASAKAAISSGKAPSGWEWGMRSRSAKVRGPFGKSYDFRSDPRG